MSDRCGERATKSGKDFAWSIDGALLLSRYCGDPLAAATLLASQHLFSRSQFE
jgi:hypothetical protein